MSSRLNVEPGVGLVFGSVRHAECSHTYKNRKGRIVRESYAGDIHHLGLDLGITAPQTVAWSVKTSGFRPYRGMLTGAMVGTWSDAPVPGARTYSALSYTGGAILERLRLGKLRAPTEDWTRVPRVHAAFLPSRWSGAARDRRDRGRFPLGTRLVFASAMNEAPDRARNRCSPDISCPLSPKPRVGLISSSA